MPPREDLATTVARLQAELREIQALREAEREEANRLRQTLAAGHAREHSTAEILRVMAAAPNDLPRVLSTIAETAQPRRSARVGPARSTREPNAPI